ncbi:MAG: ATP-binding cassette domain-containing protein, partial [Angelakisella sp.]
MTLTLDRVYYSYEQENLLQNISLTAREGRATAIMGASGRGKTTLLHIMAGLLTPDSGDVSGIPDCGVSVVFQEDRLLPWMTVLENLMVAAPEAPVDDLIALLWDLGLSGKEETMPPQLSGGMSRRVAIARALAFGSPLLLLDEPFAGLDSDTKRRTAEVIRRYSQGTTIVAVVHDDADAGLLGAEIVR